MRVKRGPLGFHCRVHSIKILKKPIFFFYLGTVKKKKNTPLTNPCQWNTHIHLIHTIRAFTPFGSAIADIKHFGILQCGLVFRSIPWLDDECNQWRCQLTHLEWVWWHFRPPLVFTNEIASCLSFLRIKISYHDVGLNDFDDIFFKCALCLCIFIVQTGFRIERF